MTPIGKTRLTRQPAEVGVFRNFHSEMSESKETFYISTIRKLVLDYFIRRKLVKSKFFDDITSTLSEVQPDYLTLLSFRTSLT